MMHQEMLPRSRRAHELYGDLWFNGEPVVISALQGTVVLLVFWDYACAESLRALPYVSEWNRKYASFGLTVVGVHTPRYAFEREPEGVARALTRLHVDFPVVVDNEGLIAAHYDIRVRPAIVLIDGHGMYRIHEPAAGSVVGIERSLQSLLHEIGAHEGLPSLIEPPLPFEAEGAAWNRPTPELEAGYLRGSLGNIEGYTPESSIAYADPGIYMDGRLYVKGVWENHRERMVLDTELSLEGQVVAEYHGLDATAVLGSANKHPIEVEVRQDGNSLTGADRGEDVRIARDGRSVLDITEPRLYRIVRNRETGAHRLVLTAHDVPLAIYALAFGASVTPDIVSSN